MKMVAVEPQSLGNSLMQSPFQSSPNGLGSPGRMSPRCVNVEHHNTCGSPLSSYMATTINLRVVAFVERVIRKLPWIFHWAIRNNRFNKKISKCDNFTLL